MQLRGRGAGRRGVAGGAMAVLAGGMVLLGFPTAASAAGGTPTTATISADRTNVLTSQAVTFTADVHATPPATGSPAASVQFVDGATVIATKPMSGGVATYTTTLSAGTHNVTAVFAGGTVYAPSTSAPVTVNVSKPSTTTTVTSNAAPSVFKQAVTFTAQVDAVPPATGHPSAQVTFSEGATVLGYGTLNAGGAATFTTGALTVGSHTITASFAGGATFLGSSGSFTQVVGKGPTATTLTSTQNPSTYGQLTTLTASTAGAAPSSGTPSGTVNFYDNGTLLGSAPTNGGTAQLTTGAIKAGSHSLTATFTGGTNYLSSTSPAIGQTVDKAASATTLTSSRNPSAPGDAVTFTTSVAGLPPGAGYPAATVQLLDGSTVIATLTLSGGSATYTTSSLSLGTHAMSVKFNGGLNFLPSTSPVLNQVVTTDFEPPQVTVAHTTDVGEWNNTSPVTVSVDVSDPSPSSGLAGDPTCTVDGNPVTLSAAPYTFEIADDGVHDVSCSATDNVGNTGSGTDTVKLDTTPPEVTLSGITDGDTYQAGSIPAVTCTTTDSLSGVADDAIATTVKYSSGENPATFLAACAGAFDVAGNSGGAAVSYLVPSPGFGGFGPPADVATGAGPGTIAVGDLNGDTFDDLVVSNHEGDSVAVLLGHGDATFDPHVDYPVGSLPTVVEVSDLDGDGDLDIAVADEGSDAVSVLMNNGDGTFASAVDYPVATPWGLTIADLDGTNGPDLAVTNPDADTVTLLLNNGDGTFTAGSILDTGYSPKEIVARDLDVDGAIDLVVGNYGSGDLSVFFNNGDGTFEPEEIVNTTSGPIDVAVADLDGDGLPDIVVADDSAGEAAIHLQISCGCFVFAGIAPIIPGADWIELHDVNGDGALDIVSGSTISYQEVWVTMGFGNGSFADEPQPTFYDSGVYSSHGVVLDLNGDGLPDAVVTNIDGSNIVIMLGLEPAAPSFTSGPPADAYVGIYYEHQLEAGAGVTYAVTSGDLPDGLSLCNCDGTIYGTPTTEGTFGPITITATNAFGTATQTFTMTVSTAETDPPTITFTSSQVNEWGWANVTDVDVTVDIVDTGVGPDPTSLACYVDGSPDPYTAPHTFSFSDTDTHYLSCYGEDLVGNSNTGDFFFGVDQDKPVTSVADVTDGDTYSASSPPTPSCSSYDLSSGLYAEATYTEVDNGDGSFTGTCSGASDYAGNVADDATVTYDLVGPPTITSSEPPSGRVGMSYEHYFSADLPISSWDVTSGTLPDGLTLCSCFGLISGTPTTEGTYGPIQVTATGVGGTATQTFTIVIEPQDVTGPVLTLTSLQVNGAGWSTTPFVTVELEVTETETGIAPAEGVQCFVDVGLYNEVFPPTSFAFSDDPAFGRTIDCYAYDNAGNYGSVTFTYGVDQDGPEVAINDVIDGGVYSEAPDPTCGTSDGESGVAVDATLSTTDNGDGTYTATCSGAVDEAGNSGPSVSATYTIS